MLEVPYASPTSCFLQFGSTQKSQTLLKLCELI